VLAGYFPFISSILASTGADSDQNVRIISRIMRDSIFTAYILTVREVLSVFARGVFCDDGI
jgi:hypothetical protein